MAKKRGLGGTGLDVLLAGAALSKSSQTGDQSDVDGLSGKEVLKQIPIEFLQPGQYQPRKDMHPEALEELAASIRVQGIMQPIIVRAIASSANHPKYEIIAGERRWRRLKLPSCMTFPRSCAM